jgi:hypothetical protein
MKCLGEKPFNGRKRPGRWPEAGGGVAAPGRLTGGGPQPGRLKAQNSCKVTPWTIKSPGKTYGYGPERRALL